MSNKQHSWVCSYDIRHPKRLKKIHDLLSMLGIAINYSVFYLLLSKAQFHDLCQKLKKIIRPQDDLRLYRCTALHQAVAMQMEKNSIYLLNEKGSFLPKIISL